MEGGQDLLRADIQVQAELRFIRVGNREIEEETTNAGMVRPDTVARPGDRAAAVHQRRVQAL